MYCDYCNRPLGLNDGDFTKGGGAVCDACIAKGRHPDHANVVKRRLNNGRARRLKKVLDARYGNGETADDVTDALTDLRHVCDKEGLSFADLDRIAYGHYCCEKATPNKGKTAPAKKAGQPAKRKLKAPKG